MRARKGCHSERGRLAPFLNGGAQRGIPLLLQSLIIVFLLSIAATTPAYAGPGVPGHWHGSPDPDACNSFNDCIYIFDICLNGHSQTLGSHVPDQIQHDVLVQMIGAYYGNCPPPLLTHSDRCKLVDVDSPIAIGLTFTANWLGNIQSLRFTGENGEAFISPISPTQFSEYKKTGVFSTMDSSGLALLAPGKYQVNCFGSEGTVGESISVTVTR